MTDAPTDLPIAEPAPAGAGDGAIAPPAPVATTRPGPTRLQRTTAIIATVGVAVAVLAFLTLLRPISTPAVDCGTSLTVLLDGRPDEYVDPADPPAGVTPAEAEAHNDEMCRARVVDAAAPAAIAIAVGLLAAVVAAAVEAIERAIGWRRRARARHVPADGAEGSAPATAGESSSS